DRERPPRAVDLETGLTGADPERVPGVDRKLVLQEQQVRDERSDAARGCERIDRADEPAMEYDQGEQARIVCRHDAADPAQRIGPPGTEDATSPRGRQEEDESAQDEEEVDPEMAGRDQGT